MSLPARLARTAARWRAGIAAHRALTAAVYGDCAEGHRIAARAIERDPSAVRALAGAWCEAILADVPRSARRPGRFRPVVVSPGGHLTARDVPVPAVWTARLVVAHGSRDWATCRALVDAVPPAEIDAHLAVLLHAAAAATVAREDDRW